MFHEKPEADIFHPGGVVVSLTYSPYLFSLYFIEGSYILFKGILVSVVFIFLPFWQASHSGSRSFLLLLTTAEGPIEAWFSVKD